MPDYVSPTELWPTGTTVHGKWWLPSSPTSSPERTEDMWASPEETKYDQLMADYDVRMSNIISEREEVQLQMSNWSSMLTEASGALNWINRWLIQDKISDLREDLREINMQGAMLRAKREYAGEEAGFVGAKEGGGRGAVGYPSWEKTRGGMATRGARAGGKPTGQVAGGPPERAEAGPPIPEWMRTFLEGAEGKGAEGRGPGWLRPGEKPTMEGPYGLRPLGAQAELSTEELQGLAGYMGWAKAGAPTEYSKGYLSRLEALPDWWEEYVRQSKKLMPKVGAGARARWRPMSQ